MTRPWEIIIESFVIENTARTWRLEGPHPQSLPRVDMVYSRAPAATSFQAGSFCRPAYSDDLEERNLISPMGTVSRVE